MQSAFTVFPEICLVHKFWQGEEMFWLLIMRNVKKERMRGERRGRRHAPSWFNLACEALFDITPSVIVQCVGAFVV